MQEVLNLYNEYTQWFNGNTLLTPIESETKPTIKIETPFLYSHNDGMIFYMQKIWNLQMLFHVVQMVIL